MKIYTRTGDHGETGLIGGDRISKASLRMEAIGSVDELNSVIGIVRLHSRGNALEETLAQVQSWLFELGSELASPGGTFAALDASHIRTLEEQIDGMSASLPPLTNFILPGGTPLAAHLHQARTVCRRAERAVIMLDGGVSDQAKAFLNRLSDWLFVAARTANASQNVPDTPWHRAEGL